MKKDEAPAGGASIDRREFRRTVAAVAPGAVALEAPNGTTTVYRIALVEIEDFAGFCLLRNLSPKGMKASVYAQFAPGQGVTVHFSADLVVPGQIAWSDSEAIGVEFEAEIDVEQVLREQSVGATGDKVKRAPRLPINCDGELVVQDRILPVRIIDISQRGVKVSGALICGGEEVSVRLPGLEQRKAVVRWSRRGTLGLNFLRPLGFRDLAEWVVEREALSVRQT